MSGTYLFSVDSVCLGSWDFFINPTRSLPSLETALGLARARTPGKLVNMRSKDQGWPISLENQGIHRKHQAWGTARVPEKPGETDPAPWLHLLLLPLLLGTPHPAQRPGVLKALPYDSSKDPEPQRCQAVPHRSPAPGTQRSTCRHPHLYVAEGDWIQT